MNIIRQANASRMIADEGDRHQWIDVRSPSEYATGHIPGAVNIPMDQIETRIDDLLADVPVVLVCQAGARARMVAGLLERYRSDINVLEGGTAAWSAAGHRLVASVKSRFSLERQVRLIAGLLVLAGVVLSLAAGRNWIFLAAFVGAGLTFAGLSDVCLMGSLLTLMPWNKPKIAPETMPCAGNPAAGDCSHVNSSCRLR